MAPRVEAPSVFLQTVSISSSSDKKGGGPFLQTGFISSPVTLDHGSRGLSGHCTARAQFIQFDYENVLCALAQPDDTSNER